MKINFKQLLADGDLRSIADSDKVVRLVKTQQEFDELIAYIFSDDRLAAMRASDAVEKITRNHPEYLTAYAKAILQLCESATNKELKWHLAALLARLDLTESQHKQAFSLLRTWLSDTEQSIIVRVNSLQSLHDMGFDCIPVLRKLGDDKPPALHARIKKLGLE